MGKLFLIILFSVQAYGYIPFEITSGSSLQRIEMASLSNSGTNTCNTVNSQTSTWISAGSSGGTGICTYTISGTNIFSNNPICVCSSDTDGNFCEVNGTGANQVVTHVYNATGTAANGSGNVLLMCMGIRKK